MTHLLDISGDDVAELDDSNLRTLVGMLCEADLTKRGLPLTAVTWGGHQNARDGGLDVRVLLNDCSIQGFVPRSNTGFQVKHSDMPAGAIIGEMRPEGVLRVLIKDLAEQGGAYVIVSAQGSTSETALQKRIEAMRSALANEPNAERLFLDFYDRNRLATWVRENPSVVPWLRDKIHRPLRGWYAYGAWPSCPPLDGEYLVDAKCRIRDQRIPHEEAFSISDGLDRIRAVLASQGSVVRLVGLSGTGKTRFVQALFDARVGHDALPSTLAFYCDFGHEPLPSPAELIQQLKRKGSEAFVVVDNCPREVHRSLTDHCKTSGGAVSLLTVEFDVADDLPEETQVFRLESASDEVIEKLLLQRMSNLSDVDRQRIVEFSGGNARIALALGGSVKQGDSIFRLADRDLFKRLFEQGQGSSETLLRTGEVASLVYSFNADTSNPSKPELEALANIAGMPIDEFYRNVKTLQDRDLIQRRGIWRALLPQALADKLARQALESIFRSNLDEALFGGSCDRLVTSFTRRLGYLHDSEAAQSIVRDWLAVGGMLGTFGSSYFNSATRFENIAPVIPDLTLATMERWINGPDGESVLDVKTPHRDIYVRVLTSVAYDPNLFLRAAWLLALFAVREPPDQRHNGARRSLGQLFRIFSSGTHASLEQRMILVTKLTQTDIVSFRNLALDLRDEMLSSGSFRSFSSHGFGSRSRDYGWFPETEDQATAWYSIVLQEVSALATSTSSLAVGAQSLLAKRFQKLWHQGMYRQLEQVVITIVEHIFWPEGWLAALKTLRQSDDSMPAQEKELLREIVSQLQPKNSFQSARVYIFSQPWSNLDVADDLEVATSGQQALDSQEAAYKQTIELGQELSISTAVDELLPDLMSPKAFRAMSFSRGLALGTTDMKLLWTKLVRAFEGADPASRNCAALVGFLQGGAARDIALTNELLNDVAAHPILREWLPILQVETSLAEPGLARLEQALFTGAARASAFYSLIPGERSDQIAPDRLNRIIIGIAKLSIGFPVAAQILYVRLLRDKQKKINHPLEIVTCGRDFLRLCDFLDADQMLDHYLAEIAKECLFQPEAAGVARELCVKFIDSENMPGSAYYLYDGFLSTLFQLQPFECLDVFFGEGITDRLQRILMLRSLRKGIFNALPIDVILEWARRDSQTRFPIIASGLDPLKPMEGISAPDWSDTALTVLEEAPNKLKVLEAFASQFVPMSWRGSLAGILENRRALLTRFFDSTDARESAWAREQDARLASIAEQERIRENKRDVRFE